MQCPCPSTLGTKVDRVVVIPCFCRAECEVARRRCVRLTFPRSGRLPQDCMDKTARWLSLVLLCTSLMGCGPQLEEPAPKPFRYARLGVTECGPDSDIVKVGFAGRTLRLPCSVAMQSATPAKDGGYDMIGLGIYYSIDKGVGTIAAVKGLLPTAGRAFLLGGVTAWNRVSEQNREHRDRMPKELVWTSKTDSRLRLYRIPSLRTAAVEIVHPDEEHGIHMMLRCGYYYEKFEEVIEILEGRPSELLEKSYCHVDVIRDKDFSMHFTTSNGGLLLSDVDRFAAELIRFLQSIEMVRVPVQS